MQNKCSNNKERSAHKNGNVTQELLQKSERKNKREVERAAGRGCRQQNVRENRGAGVGE